MKPEDKFGNPIYPRVYSILLRQGRKLIELGYEESKKSPNLFYKRCSILKTEGDYIRDYLILKQKGNVKKSSGPDVIFFADMRGTYVEKIWENTDPFFYWKFEEEEKVPDWLKRRLVKKEKRELEESYVPIRLIPCETMEPEGLFYWKDGDGFCKVCGEDFRDEGGFCSEYCRSAYEEIHKTCCTKCGKELKWNEIIKHHLSYDLNKTIDVCRSCHTKIHKSKKEPSKLSPFDKRDANAGSPPLRKGSPPWRG